MDITPAPAKGKQIIRSYGDGGFKISDRAWKGSVLVFPDRTIEWPLADISGLTVDSLRPVVEQGDVEILLIGCGQSMAFIAPDLRQALRDEGIVIESMDTGAAARTFNVLMLEDRRVAAALIAVE